MVDLTRFRIQCSGLPDCPLGRVAQFGVIPDSGGVGRPPQPLRLWPRFALILTLHGEAMYSDALGSQRRLRTGDAFFIQPGIAHAFYPASVLGWGECFIDFTGPLAELWRGSGALNPRQPFHHLEPVDYWAERFARICRDVDPSTPQDSTLRICQLFEMLAELDLSRTERGQPAGDHRWLADARHLVEAEGRAALPMGRIAARFGLSADGFRKKFTRLSGVTPARMRRRHLAQMASVQLLSSRERIATIAERLGFADVHHFSRQFKQVVGQSPAQFRSRGRGEAVEAGDPQD